MTLSSKKLPGRGAASDAYDTGNPLMDGSAQRGISSPQRCMTVLKEARGG
jgi:hypothetical protein